MSLDLVKQSLARGDVHLGDVCFWALADADVERSTLERIWNSAGLSADLLPDPPSAERALKLSVREAQIGQKDLLLRLAQDTTEELGFGVVREDRDPTTGLLRYTREGTVTLARGPAHLRADAPTHPVITAIQVAFERYRVLHTADDVRAAIVKALRSFAMVPLRPGGPPYFVPRQFSAQLRSLQTAIEQLGASRFYLLPIHGTKESQRTLSEIARSNLEHELVSLQEEIARFIEAPPERASTLLRRFEAFEDLRNRAKLFRDVLAIRVSDLDTQLDHLAQKVEQMLDAKAEQSSHPRTNGGEVHAP